jgi:hypothetical protein
MQSKMPITYNIVRTLSICDQSSFGFIFYRNPAIFSHLGGEGIISAQ